MAIPVNLFNSNTLPVNVNVNNAPAVIQIVAAGPPNYAPTTPATNPGFTGGPATPGNFGIGSNSVQITPQGAVSPFNAAVTLPASVNWTSIQFYIFFQSYAACSWLLLNNGQVISQGVVQSEAALAKA